VDLRTYLPKIAFEKPFGKKKLKKVQTLIPSDELPLKTIKTQIIAGPKIREVYDNMEVLKKIKLKEFKK
jgi:hypothetical protein